MPNFEPALLEQIKSLVPISKLVGEYVAAAPKSSPGDLWACCVFHSEKTPSFHAEDAKGIYHCFGCGATGDHFQWVQEHQGMSFTQAVEAVADRAGVSLPGKRSEPSAAKPRARYDAPKIVDPYEGYEFLPVPAGTPPIVPGQRTPELRNPKKAGTDKFTTHYKPSAVHAYQNAAGELLGYVLLVEFKDGKSTPGIWWARGPDGFEGWCHGSIDNCPLYGLPELLAHPDKQVLVVEGEKCRRAADKALQGRVVVVSWCGGTNRVDRSDWSPLAGRSVIWWADNDEEGRKAMAEARSLAKSAKNKRVTPYGDKGGDVADLILAGGSVADYIKANISEWPIEAEKENEDESVLEVASGLRGSDGVREFGKQSGKEPQTGPTGADRPISQRKPLNATPRSPSPLPSPEPDATPKDHIPPTQSVGGGGREAIVVEETIDWEGTLDRTDKATLTLNSLHNSVVILQYHSDFKGVYAYNEFAQEISLLTKPPYDPPNRPFKPRLLTEIDVIANAAYMETMGEYKLKPKVNDMILAIKRVADFNRFNPVRDALDALEWDGLPRLQGGTVGKRLFKSFAVRYLGAEDTPINAAFVKRSLISAIARAYKPGCKVDTMLVLEGGQGKFKSTSLNVLADAIAPGLFTDEMSDPGSKDAGLQMQGRWIIEISELDAFRKSDVSTLKAWLARKEDRFRRPYGKNVEDFPRSCIMIGTVNPPESGYLRDPTGARRWWPIRCGEFDLPLLKEDARQIWAEARHLYMAGEQWHLTDEEEEQAKVVQQARYEHDPWATLISDYLARHTDAVKSTVKLIDLMGDMCLRIPPERRTPLQNARIEAHLNMIGWRKLDSGTYRRGLTP